jgi:RHS repeat-associated protein
LKDGVLPVSSLAYAYGDNLNLTGITDGVTAANSNVLSYSATNRLAAASGAWGSNTFTYDSVGNRLTDVTTTKNRVATYAATSNRLNSMTENAAAFRTYSYDGAGNILTDVRPGETFAFTYNKRNRPVSVTRNTVAYATYGYNALQQLTTRVSTAVGAPVGQVAYIYDLEGHLIAEATASSGATTRDYIWAASNDNSPVDLPLAVVDIVAGVHTLNQVHTDHLGRPIRMTDAAKSTVWQALYKPFGEVQTTSGTKSLDLRFPGQLFQIETAYAYNWNRHYDPITGRYTQPDPLRFVDGPSIYAYAGNSPFMLTDREGLCPVCVPIFFGLAGVALEYLLNGDCATWQDYALAGAIGAIPGGAVVKGWKAYKYFSNLSKAINKYPKLANLVQNHHNFPKYMGGPANGPLTTLNGAYHQLITNAFRAQAAYGKSAGMNPVRAAEIMRDVYSKYPLSWW